MVHYKRAFDEAEHDTSAALDVVAYFDAPGMPTGYRPKWKTLEKARSYLQRQADSTMTEIAGIHIESFVLDAQIT
jgi:hypothetical protein